MSCLNGSLAGDPNGAASAGSCATGTNTNAVDATAGNGDTTATGAVSCLNGSLAGDPSGAASAGSCATAANAADVTAGTGDTTATGSVGCLGATLTGDTSAAASAGRCATTTRGGGTVDNPVDDGGGNGPGFGRPIGDGAPADDEGSSFLTQVQGAADGTLPLTGIPLWIAALIGLILVVGGGVLIRRRRDELGVVA